MGTGQSCFTGHLFLKREKLHVGCYLLSPLTRVYLDAN